MDCQEELKRLYQVFSTLNTGLALINEDMTIDWVNDHVYRMFPHSGEARGVACARFFSGQEPFCEQCGTCQAFRTGESFRWERYLADQSRWLSIFAQPVQSRDGKVQRVLESITDITEQKNRELQLEKLSNAVEKSPASIIITDIEGTIEYVNPVFTEITGYSEAEAVGRNPRILKSEVQDQAFYTHLWDTILSGKSWKGELCNKKKDGSLYWEYAQIAPITDSQGSIESFVAIKEDISRKKELEEMKEDVNRMLRHDLRNPLSGIAAIPALIKGHENLTQEQKELLEAMEEAGIQMLRMLDTSLDIYKIEDGSFTFTPEKVDLARLLHQLKKEFAASQGIDRIQIEGDPEQTVLSVRYLLHSMLANLIRNALEASTGKQVVIFLKGPPSGDGRKKVVTLEITNNGTVPREIRQHFFRKYVSFGKKRGTGLGTYSAKLIADATGTILEMQTDETNDTTTLRLLIPGG